jgi:hypothetical protein
VIQAEILWFSAEGEGELGLRVEDFGSYDEEVLLLKAGEVGLVD